MTTATEPKSNSGESRVVLSDGRRWSGLLPPDEQAGLWARALHRRRPGLVELVAALRLPDGTLRMRSRRRPEGYLPAGQVDQLVAAVGRHRDAGLEVFCTPLTRSRPEPGRSGGILPARVCWVDIDDPAGRERLREFPHRPHVVVASGSGGLHGYWRLARPVAPTAVEETNRKLAGAVGGDLKCTDSTRIMRVPGSFNHKAGRACRLLYLDLARPTVDAAELVAGLEDPEPAPAPPDREALRRWAQLNATDPAKQVPPPVYFRLLAGIDVPPQGGRVRCPLPDHADDNPSLDVYATAERGWVCRGCGRGGSIYDLASLLTGGPGGRRGELRDDAYRRTKRDVHELLGVNDHDLPSRRQ